MVETLKLKEENKIKKLEKIAETSMDVHTHYIVIQKIKKKN